MIAPKVTRYGHEAEGGLPLMKQCNGMACWSCLKFVRAWPWSPARLLDWQVAGPLLENTIERRLEAWYRCPLFK